MVNNEKIKIVIIAALSVLAITLFYFYLSSGDDNNDKFKDTQNSNQIVAPFSGDKMKFDIDSILYSFGIKRDWIKELTVKKKDSNNTKEKLLISKEVKIPPDLLTIDLNFEITDYLRINNFENKVTEDPKSKSIVMNILSLNDRPVKPIGNLKFVYSDTLKRNVADVCLVLDSIDEYSLSDVENMLGSTQEYSVILPLRNDKADYQSKIIELKKDYLLKVYVGIEDNIEADFKDGMEESYWKSKVRSFSINFPQVRAIILINNCRNPEFYKAIHEELTKNNITVYADSIFSGYRNSDSKVSSLFEDIISETKKGKKFLFYDINFNSNEFNIYDKQVYIMKKLGYKFFNFKELMSRINKTNEK